MTQRVRGGLRLEANKTRSTRTPLRLASVPDELFLALDQHEGAPAASLVNVGEQILMGQPVAQPHGDISAWMHSPVSGRVTAVEAESGRIVIANDGRDERYAGNSGVDYQSLSSAELCAHIDRGGIVGLGGATFPTAAKLLSAGTNDGVHLILNGAECEPWISCDDMLMRERAQDVVLGARILQRAINARRGTIAIEDDVPAAAAALRAALTDSDSIDISVQRDIYPAGGERQLILALTGQEVPSDGLPVDIGIVVQNVGTAAAIARWFRDGEPLISRIVTITGSGVKEPANLEARLGTPIASLIADCGGYVAEGHELIMGGSMMGAALTNDRLPVVKAMNCVIVATTADLQPRAEIMPCIRCGNCSEVCPASLLPQQLHWHANAGDLDHLEGFGLMDCIECGCCDYVCPSQIPLTQQFRDAKIPLRKKLQAHSDALDARLRYEARGERLVRLEEEQRARLEEKRRQLTGRKPG